MSLEQISQVYRSKALPILLDQVKLFHHELVLILEGQLREIIHQFDYLARLYLVILFQVVENTHKVRNFDC